MTDTGAQPGTEAGRRMHKWQHTGVAVPECPLTYGIPCDVASDILQIEAEAHRQGRETHEAVAEAAQEFLIATNHVPNVNHWRRPLMDALRAALAADPRPEP